MSLGFKYAALMQRYYEGNSQLDSARYMVGTETDTQLRQ